MDILNSVYRFLDKDGNIIYVGKAKNLRFRISAHSHLPEECYKERAGIEYTTFNSEDDMDYAERYYISKIKPKYNEIHKKKEINIYVPELEYKCWNKYVPCSTNVEMTKENVENDLEEEYKISIKKLAEQIKIEEEKMSVLDGLILENGNNKEMTDVLNKKRNIISNKNVGLKNKKFNIEQKLLKLKIGTIEYDNIPKWKRELMVKYSTTNEDEIIDINIEIIKDEIFDVIGCDVATKGYFYVNSVKYKIADKLVYNLYLGDCSWLKLLDEKVDSKQCHFGDMRTISNAEEIVEKIYGDCLSYLISKNMQLEQDIIVERVKEVFRPIHTEIPKLIMRVS